MLYGKLLSKPQARFVVHSSSACNRADRKRCQRVADRLTMIGPMPIIPSFSMGATRTLRITWIEAHLGDGASPLTQWTAVDAQLEHNSLLIMLPPMQERFWHEVILHPPQMICCAIL